MQYISWGCFGCFRFRVYSRGGHSSWYGIFLLEVITAAAGLDQVSYPNGQVKHRVYPLLDSKSENIALFFLDFFALIEEEISFGSILVHCAAGVSRSATLVIAYFMKKFNWTFKQAIKFVRDKRPVVLPNLGFEKQLKEFESVLNCQNEEKRSARAAQSSQFQKRLRNIKSTDYERNRFFSPTKRESLPGIRYSTALVKSKEFEKIPRLVEKDYILEIAHKEMDSQLRKSSKNNNKQAMKRSLGKAKNSKDLLISKIQSGKTKLVERQKNFDHFPSPTKNNRKDTFFEQEIKGKKLSALSYRNQLKRQGQKIMRNYSNSTKRSNNLVSLYEEVNHVVVQKLQQNERRFVTQNQLRNIGIQRLLIID